MQRSAINCKTVFLAPLLALVFCLSPASLFAQDADARSNGEEPKAITDEFRPTPGQYLADDAVKLVGNRYHFGGESITTGFDCSGLVCSICHKWKINLPRTAADQSAMGAAISSDLLFPGDLLFWQNTYKPGISHVGIYIGDGKYVHAANEANGVMVGQLNTSSTSWAGARRLDLSRLPAYKGVPAPTPPVTPYVKTVVKSEPSKTESPYVDTTKNLARVGKPGDKAVRVCSDTGQISNSACTSTLIVYMASKKAARMKHCRQHKPPPGEE